MVAACGSLSSPSHDTVADDDVGPVAASDAAAVARDAATADLPPAARPLSPPVWTGKFTDMTAQLPAALVLPRGQRRKSPDVPKAWPHWCSGALIDVTGDTVADLVHYCQGGAVRVVTGLDTTQPVELSGLEPKSAGDGRIHGVALTDRLGDGGRDLVLVRPDLATFRRVGLQWTDHTAKLGIPVLQEPRRQAVHVADLDGDGLLDLIVAHYQCGQARPGEVWLARGDGSYEERGKLLGVQGDGAQWAALAADLDDDGDQDVVLLQDGCGEPKTTQHFWRNEGRGPDGWPKFARTAPHAIFQFPKPFPTFASPMAAAAGDFDGDGRCDLAISNVGIDLPDETLAKLLRTDDPTILPLHRNLLLRQRADGTFEDVGLAAGIKTATDPVMHLDLTAWAIGAFDFDRDGWLDLAMANAPEADAYALDKRGPMRPVLWRNRGDGHFDEVSAQAGWPPQFAGLGLSLGDVDGDGDDDVALGGLGAPPRLLRNDVQTPYHGLRLVLRGTVSNSLGIGAMVEVVAGGRTQRRLVGAASAFSTQHDPVAAFGLGSAAKADGVTVRWPSGWVQQVGAVAADQVHVVTEPPLLEVSPRVVAAGGIISVTAQAHAADATPQPVPAEVALVPPGVLTWQEKLQCTATGACQGALAVAQSVKVPTAVFVKVSFAGVPLKVWPRITVLP